MTGHDYDEKRDFHRMNINTEITFTIKNSDGQTHHALSKDLSATGLYMETSFAPKEGDELDLVMTPNGEVLPPLHAHGSVIRVAEIDSEPSRFNVSLKLDKLS